MTTNPINGSASELFLVFVCNPEKSSGSASYLACVRLVATWFEDGKAEIHNNDYIYSKIKLSPLKHYYDHTQ